MHGMKILSSGFHNTRALDYLTTFVDSMLYIPSNMTWFKDQELLFDLLEESHDVYNIVDISKMNVINWDVGTHQYDNAKVNYPKGPRKNHPYFLKQKTELETKFDEVLKNA